MADNNYNLDDYPESTHKHLSEIKKMSFDENKSDKEIAEKLKIDEYDITEAVMLLEMDVFDDEEQDDIEVENTQNFENQTNGFKEFSVFGSGGEIVIGTIKSKFVEALQKIDKNELNEEHIEEITGSPWSEIDNIWHFYGPFEEFELEDINGNKFSCNDSLDWDWDKSKSLIKNFTKKPVKNVWDLSFDERYLIIVVNGEKGFWGKLKVPTEIDIDQLKVISGDSEFDTEYCVTLGFTYQDEILEWEEDGETRGTYRKIKIFDIQQEAVILEI